jgi:signal peptidase
MSRRDGELAAVLGLCLAVLLLARPREDSAPAAPPAPEPAAAAVKRRSPSRRLAGIATAAVVAFAVGVLAVVVLGRVSGEWQLIPILSGSMAPTMPVGSLAIAHEEPVASIHRGQVIVYRSPLPGHELIAHRVVRLLGRSGPHLLLTTKGDANRAADPWQTAITGSRAWVVGARIPVLGYVAAALRQGPLLLLAGALLTLLAVANLARSLHPPAREGRRHAQAAAR